MSDSVLAHRAIPRTVRDLLLALAACAGIALAVAACSAPAPGTAASGPGGTQVHAAPAAGSGPVAIGMPATRSPETGNPQLTSLVPAQSIIYTANLTVRARDVSAAATAATGIVTAAGGYVAGERQVIPSGRGSVARVSMTLKIPVAAYPAALAKLGGVGKRLAFGERAIDVTQQVADVGSRVASAQAAIRQLRALLIHAGSVSELLSVQDEINAQEAQLEALLAQQRSLARETSYATVSLVVIGQRARVVHHPRKSSHGFLAGVAAGWRALVTAVTWLLTAVGAILPSAVVVAILAAIGVAARRRVTRRRTATAAGPPADVT